MFAFWSPGPAEMIVVLVVALLLFGRRLPEVCRSLGRGIVEFRKGLRGIEDEVEKAGSEQPLPPVPEPPPSPRGEAEKTRADSQ